MKKCGREVVGKNVAELGPCPAANNAFCDGINDGYNGGRICWAIAGTFCGGKIQGNFAQKSISCMSCEVYKKIKEEEGEENFILLKPGQVYKASSR